MSAKIDQYSFWRTVVFVRQGKEAKRFAFVGFGHHAKACAFINQVNRLGGYNVS